MHENTHSLETRRWTVLALTMIFTTAAGTVVMSMPVAAAQFGNPSVIEIQLFAGIAGLPQKVILVFGTMTVLAVAVMVTFGHFASRSSANGDPDSTQSIVTDGEREPKKSVTDATSQGGPQSENTTGMYEAVTPTVNGNLELTDLDHVAESRADTLCDAGYESVAEVHEAEQDALTDVDGFGAARVKRITESAAALLEQQHDTGAEADNATTVEEVNGENEGGDDADTTDEDERPRAVVTFDPETASGPEDVDEENPPDEAEDGDHLRLRTILSTILTGPDPNPTPDNTAAAHATVEEDDSSTAESTDADGSTLTPTITQSEVGERTEQSAIERARATVTTGFAVICGRARMLCDRRALDLRAYGVEDEWTALTFECGDPDSAVDRELLEELVYVGAVPIEVATEPESAPESERESENENRPETTFADHTHAHLPASTRVRLPRRSIEWVETAAQADRPEAKRTVVLLRQALRATGASSAEVATGSGQ